MVSTKSLTSKPEGLKLARLCKKFAADKKAENTIILNLTELEGPSDFFVICSASSEPQIKAIANHIEASLKEKHQISPYITDGRPASQWMIMDYSTVMVHIMHHDRRSYYDIEGLWSDAKKVR